MTESSGILVVSSE